MNNKMLITFLCFSAISPMMAQDIKGKIVDEKGQPLAFANVVLLIGRILLLLKVL